MILNIDFDSYLELEKISNGSFLPLKGFMVAEDFFSVCKNMRLKNGKLFPLPVILPISKINADKVKFNEELLLYYNNKKVGSILPQSIFEPDLKKYIKLLFGTNDINHPGYKMIKNMGPLFLGGPIKSFYEIKNKYTSFTLTPRQCIAEIKKRGLKTVAGFQTRNVPHKAHEYILLSTLKKVDGLFVQPLIGKKKRGDFLPEAVIKSYQYLIDKVYKKNNIILGSLTTYMRYAGPREGVFHALIRKNYGCTHFLVGRDHAGVGDYYGLYDAQNLCLKYEKELGIKIIKVRGPFYCKKCLKITNDLLCRHKKSRIEVSGTKIRNSLLKNLYIEDIFMRKEIVDLIRKNNIFIK